jgi:phosphate/sulfate permease
MCIVTPRRAKRELFQSTAYPLVLRLCVWKVLGLPVSTSHCLIGSIIGVGFAQQCTGEKSGTDLSVAYNSPHRSPHTVVLPLIRLVPQVMGRIVITWILTIPAAMLVAFLIYSPLATVYGG